MSDLVLLLTFNREAQAPTTVREDENYWKLIGKLGLVVEDIPIEGVEPERVLVKFFDSLDLMNLHSHNHVANALWIRRSDLRLLSISEYPALQS